MAKTNRSHRAPWIALGVVGLLGASWWWLDGKRAEIVLTQAQIDQGLAKIFPQTKRHLILFSVEYSEPELTLLEQENRIRVAIRATVENLRVDDEPPITGRVVATTGLRFEPDTHAFHLDDAELESVQLAGLPTLWLEPVNRFTTELLESVFDRHPVYVLEAKDAKTAAARLLLKSFSIRDQQIHIELGV